MSEYISVVQTMDGSAPANVERYSITTINRAHNADKMQRINIRQSTACPRGIYRILVNVLCGLHQCDNDIVYICEHDVLYPPDYFDASIITEDITYAALSFFLTPRGYVRRDSAALSSIAGNRSALIAAFEKKLAEHVAHGRVKWVEPNCNGRKLLRINKTACVDVRHGNNYTGDRRGGVALDAITGWPPADTLWRYFKNA